MTKFIQETMWIESFSTPTMKVHTYIKPYGKGKVMRDRLEQMGYSMAMRLPQRTTVLPDPNRTDPNFLRFMVRGVQFAGIPLSEFII